MVRIDKFEYGEVRYCDCMDKEYGLPSLKDKSFDLCFTDFPYGVDYNGKGTHKTNILYEDDINFKKQQFWFNECYRISVGLYFVSGTVNLYDFIQYKKPDYLPKYNYLPINRGYFHVDVYLGYGKIKNITKIRDVKITINDHKTNFYHPSPKPLPYVYYIIKKLKPISVIDPFLGSGTTAEVCTKLGTPFLGYEIKEEYKHDIDLRLKNCKKEPKQVSLLQYNNGVKANTV